MLRAKLIIGGNLQKRLTLVKKIIEQETGLSLDQPHPDIFTLQGFSSIGIDQIRNLKNKLSLRPFQAKKKLAVILEAEKLTLPAQNAFLKTLEETPTDSLIILAAPAAEFFLPTVISRCQLIKLPITAETQTPKTESADYRRLFLTLATNSAGAKLRQVPKYASKKELTSDFVLNMLGAGRILIHQEPSLAIARNLRLWQKTFQIIQANVNPSLALGNLFLLLS